jgi:hypothetical protein
MLNSYLNLEGRHPLLAGLEDAKRIINGVYRVHVKPSGPTSSPLSVVPTYPDLPMEEVFERPVKVHDAGVFLREFGKGRVVYFPWDVDRSFWNYLNADHARLLKNTILWATNEPPPVSVIGPGIIDLSIWAQKNSLTVHLVNLTNPMMMKGPIREIIPLSRQQVRIQLPQNERVPKVKLLVAEKDVPHRQENGVLSLEVPAIGLHEVIALDFA